MNVANVGLFCTHFRDKGPNLEVNRNSVSKNVEYVNRKSKLINEFGGHWRGKKNLKWKYFMSLSRLKYKYVDVNIADNYIIRSELRIRWLSADKELSG